MYHLAYLLPLHQVSVEYYLGVTDFYLNPDYILWYKNLASFVVTLLVPLMLLGFYNGTTYKLINKRYIRLFGGKIAIHLYVRRPKPGLHAGGRDPI